MIIVSTAVMFTLQNETTSFCKFSVSNNFSGWREMKYITVIVRYIFDSYSYIESSRIKAITNFWAAWKKCAVGQPSMLIFSMNYIWWYLYDFDYMYVGL